MAAVTIIDSGFTAMHHDQDGAIVRARNTIQILEETLQDLLALDHPAESVLSMMSARVAVLFPGLGETECEHVVSLVIEQVRPRKPRIRPATAPAEFGGSAGNVIRFRIDRATNRRCR